MSSTTLFGAPLGYTANSLAEWISVLELCWVDFAGGHRPAALAADLALLRPIFGHGAPGGKLRAAFGNLREPGARIELPADVALSSEGLDLITPEGRILLDVLHRLRRRGEFVIDAEMQTRALALAVETRTGWYESWAHKQLTGSLSLPPIAAAILILINGSATPTSGFYLPDDETAAADYETAVIDLLGNFSEALGGQRPAQSPLRNHWAFTQATRVLSRDLERTAQRGGARVHLRENRERHLLADLHSRLAKYPRAQVQDAVRALVDQYGRHRGLFTAVGGSNERASHTRAVVETLLHGEAD